MTDQPVQNLKVDGVPIRSTPPYVVEYCRTPATGYGLTTCGYQATTCQGQLIPCHRCHFHYCETHYGTHHKSLLVPRMVMAKFVKQVAEGIAKAAAEPTRTVYLRPDKPHLSDAQEPEAR